MSDLQALINAIPIVNVGDVITKEHHNSLREAIVALSTTTGDLQGEATYTLTPNFNPWIDGNTTRAEWRTAAPGEATLGGTAADGWIPLSLPNGMNIKSIAVAGRKLGGAPAQFDIILLRKSVRDPGDTVNLIILQLRDVTEESLNRSREQLTSRAQQLQNPRKIDTVNYFYAIQAKVLGAPAAGNSADIALYSLSVTVTP